jgi:subtilisin family serine protease
MVDGNKPHFHWRFTNPLNPQPKRAFKDVVFLLLHQGVTMRENIISKRIIKTLLTRKSPCNLRVIKNLSIVISLLLFTTFLVSAQTPSPKNPKSEIFKGKKVAASQVLVKFRQEATAQNIEQAKKNIDADTDRKVGKSGIRLLRSRSKNIATLIQELSTRADVLYVEPNYLISVSGTPNDESFSQVWGLQNTGQAVGSTAGIPGADISAVAAWEVSTGSRQNVVAILDTGVDYTHPDLAANMWSAPAAFTVNIGDQVIRCEAGTHGFDVITRTCNPMDEYNHGTHMAGTIGAVGNNGLGISGVNQTASMMAIKFIDATGNGTVADAIDAIDFVIQAKQALGAAANVRVLSNSWGWNGEPSQALLDEINRANDSNMLFVAGAGNGGDDRVGDDNDIAPFYPGSYDAPNVIAVAATDNNDRLASLSNYGAERVHLGAPGVLVLSTTLGGSYDWWSGTSMATPHVAGAAALVLSRCSLDTSSLKKNILDNVDQVGSLSGVTTTGGRLNVSKAIHSCANLPAAPTIELTNVYDGMTYPVYSSVVLQANASDSDGTVSKVDYYVDGKLIDTATTSPYTAHWYATEVGEYMLTGVATDNSGMTTTSRPVKVIINETIIPEPSPAPTPNQAPTVSLTSPLSGATYNAPATIIISANASDSDGTVTGVRFYSNSQLIGTATASPYSITWSNVAAGSYSLQAVVSDNGGISVGSNVVSVMVETGKVPTSTTGSTSYITSTTAQLNGTITPNGAATKFWFEWGTSSSLATFNSTAQQAISSIDTSVTVSAGLNGLSSSTKYYFRVAASNSAGTSRGAILSFTTNTAQTSTAQPAQLISPADGSTFNSSSATFTWNTVAGVSQYFLDLNSSPGSRDIFSDYVSNGSTTVSGIPTDGRTVYVRLWSNINGTWLYNDYRYTATH